MNLARGEAATIITDPAFRSGYRDAWSNWKAAQNYHGESRRAYDMGHAFAVWLREQGEPQRSIMRGGVASSEIVAALIHFSMCGPERAQA